MNKRKWKVRAVVGEGVLTDIVEANYFEIDSFGSLCFLDFGPVGTGQDRNVASYAKEIWLTVKEQIDE